MKESIFFWIKVHMIIDCEGIPIEFSFTLGSCSDIKALRFTERSNSFGR